MPWDSLEAQVEGQRLKHGINKGYGSRNTLHPKPSPYTLKAAPPGAYPVVSFEVIEVARMATSFAERFRFHIWPIVEQPNFHPHHFGRSRSGIIWLLWESRSGSVA